MSKGLRLASASDMADRPSEVGPDLGFRVSSTSVVGDSRWRMDIRRGHLREGAKVIRFDRAGADGVPLTDPRNRSMLDSVKHVLWRRRFRPTARHRLLGDVGMMRLAEALIDFALFLSEQGVRRFSLARPEDVAAYGRRMSERMNPSSLRLAYQRHAMAHFWTMRDLLDDALLFRPFGGSAWAAVQRRQEGATPAIPPEVLLPLMSFCLQRLDEADEHVMASMPWPGRPSREQWVLLAACYAVVAFMTGARISEVASLRADGIEAHEGAGGVRRYRLHGVTWKNTPDGQGRPTWWGVPERGAKAARVAVRLTEAIRARGGSDAMFVGRSKEGGCVPFDSRLVQRLMDMLLDATGLDGGRPGSRRLTTHMFRTTLAQWLAREPDGVVHGALHMKHVSAATFQGYLRQDQEFQKLRDVHVLAWQADVYEDISRAPVVAGRGGDAIMRARVGAAPPPPMLTRLADEARPDEVERAVARGRALVFKTRYGHCLFDRQAARCLAGALDSEDRPRTHACQPAACANCCVLPGDVAAWKEDIAEYEAIKAMPSATQGQVETCDREARMLRQVIAPLEALDAN